VPRTVADLLREATDRLRASGSESARLDAELLVGHALRLDRTRVLAHPEAPVSDGQAELVETLVQRRETGEPVAYIRGIKEFHGLAFMVDERVLIPRPDTERIVELALDRVRHRLTAVARPADAARFVVWDLGTGSGAICISLAVALRQGGYLSDVRLVATDVSTLALGATLENAVAHGVADVIELRPGNLLRVEPDLGPVDLLVANLPYIPSATLATLPVAVTFEPRLALDGGPDGLGLIRHLLKGLPTALVPDGQALLEMGSDQVEGLTRAVAEALPGWTVSVHADLSGRPRVAQLDPPSGHAA
jgi:release factor glutamine methyltransferase